MIINFAPFCFSDPSLKEKVPIKKTSPKFHLLRNQNLKDSFYENSNENMARLEALMGFVGPP